MTKHISLALVTACLTACVGTGAAPGADACDTGELDLLFQNLQAVDSCFVIPGADQGNPADLISIGATSTTSASGTGNAGIQLVFSADPSCSFGPGAIIQLTNPCLFVGAAAGDPAIPSGLFGYVNTCAFNGASGSESEACTTAGAQVDTSFTTGSLTINVWSTLPGGEIGVTFSSDAALTAVNPNGAGLSDYAVQVSGMLTAVVPGA